MILVPLLNPKFASHSPLGVCELRFRGTSGHPSFAPAARPAQHDGEDAINANPRAPAKGSRVGAAGQGGERPLGHRKYLGLHGKRTSQ